MLVHDFTKIIRSRGWTVAEACEFWQIREATYNARCNNSRMQNQLKCMCKGLEDKINEN